MRTIMKKLNTGVITTALLLLPAAYLFCGTASAAETAPAKESSLTERPGEYIRDYLSDPRRSGSLAGSILGGAMFAHPAGPIVGSLVGFIVGKQTMYNEDKTRGQKASLMYAKRDIVPQAGEAAPTLSFASSQGIVFDAQPAANVLTTTATATTAATPEAPLAPAGLSRVQIAAMCTGQASMKPRLQALCYYFQGS
ncbi:MAG: hypothetical protein B7Y41_02145 [Hydrogenophilales bacterium 28-61-23]|nr:MAG: hypothetical protein B7Y41_02145 [Hydrogenophilales bacterium 28-61-23]